jgi:hypothetical protein
MTYLGHIESGKVVFDEPAPLDEGARVRVELFPADHDAVLPPVGKTLAEELASVIGRANGLPRDSSQNHDRYLRDEHSA